jgi:hypothetical protein
MYYSTGKSPYLGYEGKPLSDNVSESTVKVLLERGLITENKIEVQIQKEVTERETKVIEIEQPKRKGNPNWRKK